MRKAASLMLSAPYRAHIHTPSRGTTGRTRRTQVELDRLDAAIIRIARVEAPITVRGLSYRVMSEGLVPKSEHGYAVVQREALKLRRTGRLPHRWIADGSRTCFKPRSYANGQEALENTARAYRRDMWIDTPVHVEAYTSSQPSPGLP
jgi:hypothetical protein